MKKLDLKHGYTVSYNQNYNNGFSYCMCVPNGDDFKARMEYTTCKDYMQDIVANMYRNDTFSQFGLKHDNHLKLSKDEETYYMAIFFKGTSGDSGKEKELHKHLMGSASNIITLVNHFDNLYGFKPASIQECELIGHPENYTNCLVISFDKNWYNSAITISFMNMLIKVAYAYTGGDVKDFFNNIDKYNTALTSGQKIINGNEINYIMSTKHVINALIDGWLPPVTDWSLYADYSYIHNGGIVKYAGNFISFSTYDYSKEAKESYNKFIELCKKKELITT